MVLQTSCRCLRQVEKGKEETAIIWLNEDNAQVLQKQLKEEQQTSIAEINRLSKTKQGDMLERYSRLEYLKLPKVEFYQLKVEYDALITNEVSNPREVLSSLEADDFFDQAIIAERRLGTSEAPTRTVISEERGEAANFNRWLFEISKASFGKISISELKQFSDELRNVFNKITIEENGERLFNDLYDRGEIQSQIRLAFHTKRERMPITRPVISSS
jgi:type III restriction enzyme